MAGKPIEVKQAEQDRASDRNRRMSKIKKAGKDAVRKVKDSAKSVKRPRPTPSPKR